MGEWKRVKLGEVADLTWGDTATTKAKYTDTGYLAYSASGPDGLLPYADFDREGVVLSAIGADCGETWLAKGKWSCIKNTIRFWSKCDDVNTAFLYWRTKGKNLWPKRGSAQPFISQGDARAMEITYPDLPIQRRIAAVLGALDDKIEVNRKICENLEAQAQALFKGMKRRAEESSFVQVIDILSGGTPKTSVPEYWNGDIPFFSPKDVGGLFTISTERNITDQGLANCNSILYPKGTTFVTARGTVGKVCLAGVPMAMNQSCFALASNEIDPLLVYFYTCASVDSLKSKANGSVFAAITIAEFETEKIHRLADSEEERFVKTIRPMFDQILVRQQESRALAAMRDALLPKLMSGELVVEKVEG